MNEVEIVQVASGGLMLEGRFRPRAVKRGESGGAGAVICHPHPRFGGSMDNNVVCALEDHLASLGVATLCFNFRGVGGSQGEWDEMRGEVDDVLGALTWLAKRPELDAGRIGLAGYSFGGLMAAYACARIGKAAGERAARNNHGSDFRVKALALVSPMPPARGWEAEKELMPMYAKPPPAIIIAGTADRFCPVKSAQDLAVRIGPEARLVILEGVDHFYGEREDEAGKNCAEFMARSLGR
ncbi:MAG TPA: alpha/beta fold hydrolase [bacterium]|nr:alpha/beta fold hydrolase [bacterium]